MAPVNTKQKRQRKPVKKPARRGLRRAASPVRAPRVGANKSGTDEAVLAVFAHDIRTALTGILALGELLASSNIGERERRWASGIKTSAEHLAALTTLVIDAAKADAGSLTL
jgi:signal transduction histidine kinase